MSPNPKALLHQTGGLKKEDFDVVARSKARDKRVAESIKATIDNSSSVPADSTLESQYNFQHKAVEQNGAITNLREFTEGKFEEGGSYYAPMLEDMVRGMEALVDATQHHLDHHNSLTYTADVAKLKLNEIKAVTKKELEERCYLEPKKMRDNSPISLKQQPFLVRMLGIDWAEKTQSSVWYQKLSLYLERITGHNQLVRYKNIEYYDERMQVASTIFYELGVHLIRMIQSTEAGMSIKDADKKLKLAEAESYIKTDRPCHLHTIQYKDESKTAALVEPLDPKAFPAMKVIRDRPGLVNLIRVTFGHLGEENKFEPECTFYRHGAFPPFALKNEKERRGIAVKNIKSLLEYIIRDQLGDIDLASVPDEMTLNYGNLTLLSPVGRAGKLMQGGEHERPMLLDTIAAFDEVRRQGKIEIDYKGKKISLTPKIIHINIPVNFLGTSPFTDENKSGQKALNEQGFVEFFDFVTAALHKKSDELSQESNTKPIIKEILKELMLDVNPERDGYELAHKKLCDNWERQRDSIDNLEKILIANLKSIKRGPADSKNLIDVFSSMQLFIDAMNMVAGGKYKGDKYPVELPQRILALGQLSGLVMSLNCKQAKDRAGLVNEKVSMLFKFRKDKGYFPVHDNKEHQEYIKKLETINHEFDVHKQITDDNHKGCRGFRLNSLLWSGIHLMITIFDRPLARLIVEPLKKVKKKRGQLKKGFKYLKVEGHHSSQSDDDILNGTASRFSPVLLKTNEGTHQTHLGRQFSLEDGVYRLPLSALSRNPLFAAVQRRLPGEQKIEHDICEIVLRYIYDHLEGHDTYAGWAKVSDIQTAKVTSSEALRERAKTEFCYLKALGCKVEIDYAIQLTPADYKRISQIQNRMIDIGVIKKLGNNEVYIDTCEQDVLDKLNGVSMSGELAVRPRAR